MFHLWRITRHTVGAIVLFIALGLTVSAKATIFTFAYEGVINSTFGDVTLDAFLGENLRLEPV